MKVELSAQDYESLLTLCDQIMSALADTTHPAWPRWKLRRDTMHALAAAVLSGKTLYALDDTDMKRGASAVFENIHPARCDECLTRRPGGTRCPAKVSRLRRR